MSGKPKTPQVSKVTIEAKAFHDLQQAEAKYRSTFENAAEGIFQSTPRGGEIKARVAQLTALHKTLLDITPQRDLTKLLQAIVQRAARLLKGTSGGLYLCDAEKQECTCVVSYKTPRDYTGTVLRYGEGAAGKVAASGQPLQIDDYRAWEGHAKAFESEQPFRAVLAAPLLWHGGVTGVIDVLREQPFTQADLELLTMFASQAGIAIENARELEAERATRIQLEKEITERKRVEEQIAYQAPLLAIVNDAVVASDAQYRITAWNAAAESMYGWKAEEVLGRFGVDITRTKYTGVDKAEMLRAIAERGSWRGEVTQARKYGTRIPVEISSMVLRAESGQITGYVSVNRDITGRKRAEEALRKSEERYRELFENMMDGFAYCRMSFDDKDCPVDFVYLAVNTAFEQLTGLKNAVGHRITEVIPGIKEAHPELFEIYGRVAMTGQPERFEVYFKPLAMWMSIAVYSPTEGYFVTVFDDITERKRAEEALRESHARLAHLSHRLVEAQEEERRRIARELHDEVGQSLTALTISLEGVSQLALEGAMRGKIAEIQELTKNLIAEVNALSVELRPRVLDDLGLIPGLLSLFSRFSSQTGVEIDFKHTGIKRKRVTPEIEISAYRIIQEALTNVVRHADVKTTSVRLQVEADMLWIQVQDEGKGFDLQQAMKAEDSMGLLSMTERAEQVGGWLEVQTAPGEGTLITCQLPLGGSHVDKEGV